MTSIDVAMVDDVVRQMLDAMRNAHLQAALGKPERALEYLDEAANAHERLGVLFQDDPANEALVGRILFRVIEQRVVSLGALVQECLAKAKPAEDVVAFGSKPLDPSYVAR
jgi:hypothetical protein